MSPTETPTDIQAIRAALEALLPDFQDALSNFLFGLLHHRQTAEDASQETLLKALLALEKGTGHLPPPEPEEIKRWLYRIARNTAIDLFRRRKLKTWLPLSLFIDDRGIGAGLSPEEGSYSAHRNEQAEEAHLSACLSSAYNGATFEDEVALRDLVDQALKQLPADYADCLRLFALDDYSCPEIAHQMRTTHEAVKMRLYRARKMLAAFYQENC
jgi:RNA polymerase sigma-70 factor (ECF subfamily)